MAQLSRAQGRRRQGFARRDRPWRVSACAKVHSSCLPIRNTAAHITREAKPQRRAALGCQASNQKRLARETCMPRPLARAVLGRQTSNRKCLALKTHPSAPNSPGPYTRPLLRHRHARDIRTIHRAGGAGLTPPTPRPHAGRPHALYWNHLGRRVSRAEVGGCFTS